MPLSAEETTELEKLKATPMISKPDTRALVLSSDTSSIPATKQFAINATSNLFVATTLNKGADGATEISQEAETAFGQVSVFFAAMTKAMAEANKSLYDFDAMSKLISASGLFVKVNQTDIQFKSSEYGIRLGSELIETLLGLSGNLASIAKSFAGLVQSVGKESIEIALKKQDKTGKVGSIVFVCEYLLGAVSITPIAIYTQTEQAIANFEAGPCLKYNQGSLDLTLTKEVYLFVPPTFMKEAAALNTAMANPDFLSLVNQMKQSIEAQPTGQ